MGWDTLYEVARGRHHGAFALRDAPSVGLTPRQVQARAARDPWHRPYPGVVFVPGFPLDHRGHLAAAQLHLGASAAATEVSGLWLYGLVSRAPVRPHLLLPHARRVVAANVVIRRSRVVGPEDRTIVDGISVLRVPFLLLSLAPRTSLDALRTIALDARQRRLLDVTELAARLATVGRVPGRARAVRLLAELGRDGSDSMFESLVRERLRAAGLHPSDAPVPVRTADGRIVHLDIAFPDERVAIECQGFVAHHSRRQLDRDARRDNSIALAVRWLVLKLTWDRFHHDWENFLAQVRQALRTRHPRPGSDATT
jgi:hypothetical protein